MKKLYQTPQISVVLMTTTNMIALSGELDSTKTINSSDAFGSRGGDSWDDDEY